MSSRRRCSAFVVALLLFLTGKTEHSFARNGQPNPTPIPTPSSNAPPAPVLAAPANGASLVQPITLDWNAVGPGWTNRKLHVADRNYIRVYQHHRFRLYQHGFRSVGFDADCGQGQRF